MLKMNLSVTPERKYCSFQNILRKFPLLWRVDPRSLSQFDFKTGNFVLIKLCSSAELQSWTRNKSVWGAGKDLK